MCVPAAQGRENGYRETDQPVTHIDKLLTQLHWTTDYTSGHQNLGKTMLDNEIAPLDHYREPKKFGKV